MRIGARGRAGALLVTAVVASMTCSTTPGNRFFRLYEYEEEMYLALDGSATLYVNGSVPALNALQGMTLDERPNARLDRDAVRSHFTAAATRVTRVSSSRRSNRRFYHVRMDVDDVRSLGTVPPFGWSTYAFAREGEIFVYRQAVGSRQNHQPRHFDDWKGDEIVAFRLHLPSRVQYHNSGGGVQRGNILEWEQPLADRLRGAPLQIDARMAAQSILYTTLLLFAGTGVAVAGLFTVVIWRIRRSAARSDAGRG
jgi:hypothetical protein